MFVGFSPSYDEIRGADLLAGVESSEAVKSATPLTVIRTKISKRQFAPLLPRETLFTLPLFQYPGGCALGAGRSEPSWLASGRRLR